MDISLEYAAHQHAVTRADYATSNDEGIAQLTRALSTAARINAFPHKLGAAAACAWSMAQVSAPGRV